MCLGPDTPLLAVLGSKVIEGRELAPLASVKDLCVGVLHLHHELGANRGLALCLPQLGGHVLNFVLSAVHEKSSCRRSLVIIEVSSTGNLFRASSAPRSSTRERAVGSPRTA